MPTTYYKTKKVYIVEDNPDICELIHYLVTKIGCQVSTCSNLKEFNNLIRINRPDLIILDIMLPDGNGLDICEALKTHLETSSIPIILMSANLYIQEQIDHSQANDFISKPFDINDFSRRVKIQMAS